MAAVGEGWREYGACNGADDCALLSEKDGGADVKCQLARGWGMTTSKCARWEAGKGSAPEDCSRMLWTKVALA